MLKLKKIGRLLRAAWLMIGIALLLLCLVEAGFSLFFLILSKVVPPKRETEDSRIKADSYSDSSWVKSYFSEFDASNFAEWKPYVYWRRRPYRGANININNEGLRQTTSMQEGRQESTRPAKIFMFGGSTLWGTGARDNFTIPSALARELKNRGVLSEITNFGESGYVSTQEVITLMLELRKGHIPKLVIFYDGVNDIYSAYQQHVAGIPQNEFNRAREFNLTKPDRYKERRVMVVRDLAATLSTVRFAQGLSKKMSGQSEESSSDDSFPLETAPLDGNALAQQVVNSYSSNIEIVKALSEHYRFNYLCYWQPTVFQKVKLTKYENAERDNMQMFGRFLLETYNVLKQGRLAENTNYHFHDLSQVFSEVQEPVYIDWCHLGEGGNEMIAKRMVDDVVGAITEGKEAAN